MDYQSKEINQWIKNYQDDPLPYNRQPLEDYFRAVAITVKSYRNLKLVEGDTEDAIEVAFSKMARFDANTDQAYAYFSTVILGHLKQLVGARKVAEDKAQSVYKIAEADVPTKNGMVYPKSVLASIVSNFKGPILGRMGIPKEAVVRLNDVSHQVVRLELEGNSLYAEIKPFPTPNGRILSKLIQDDQVRFCPSGVGSAHKDDNGNFVIDEKSYRLISVDALFLEEEIPEKGTHEY